MTTEEHIEKLEEGDENKNDYTKWCLGRTDKDDYERAHKKGDIIKKIREDVEEYEELYRIMGEI